MKYFLSIILVLLVSGTTYAQDPGIPDTVNFGECQSYIVADGDSLYGKVKIPLRIFNDENLCVLIVDLKWEGTMKFDTLVFFGTRAVSIDEANYVFDDSQQVIGIAALVYSGEIPVDTGIFLNLFFHVFDTGLFRIDTNITDIPESPLWFYDCIPNEWRPIFEAKEFRLVKSDTIPGDLNGNNLVNLADVVILINFLFKNYYSGFLKPAADVNCDCEINMADIVYLINWLFRIAEKPKPGCAWN